MVDEFWLPEGITAVRAGMIIVDLDGRARFAGVGHGHMHYDREATATCAHGRDHSAPQFSCSCGFWACPDRDTLELAMAIVGRSILDCELSGTVIEHVLGDDSIGGWRAERITIHAAHHTTRCWCGNTADGFGLAPRLSGEPVQVATPWCEGCVELSPVVDELVDAGELSDRLGVAVDHDDTDHRLPFVGKERLTISQAWMKPPTFWSNYQLGWKLRRSAYQRRVAGQQ